MPEPSFPPTKVDRLTWCFLVLVALAAVVYVAFALTPSSYGSALDLLKASDQGPTLGSSRIMRSDEWAVSTPYFQAAVRNRFQRFNEASFYHEDLRNFYALPLADWSLVFKPQLWAFFVLPPAIAFSIYFAVLMIACLVGYQFLFRQLGAPSWLAVGAAAIVFFSGFTQFWWTTYGPLVAGLPWVLVAVLQPMRAWKKALLCVWVFPTFVLSHSYPTLLIALAWGGLILVLAVRPSLLRSYGDIAAIAAGVLSAAVVTYVYYADVIPIMRNTVYPGHRISPAGTTSVLAVVSQLFPFVSFRLGDYQFLDGQNICEIGAVGSFLPLLTLCALRYRALREDTAVRKALLILLAGFAAITLWEIAPVPGWIGRLLLWNTGSAPRWLFTSGLLLTMASVLIWRDRLIGLQPGRIILFLLLGPVASIVIKLVWLMHTGEPPEAAVRQILRDILLCGLLLLAGLAACYAPGRARAPILVTAIVLVNIYAFGRFNPLQPAEPIFDVPDTTVVRDLKREEAASPGGVLVDPRFFGAVLGGLGFRSVAYALLAPKLTIFRSYFPAMEWEQFNQIFNRYAHIQLTPTAFPDASGIDSIRVPIEVFVPVRNIRQVVLGPPNRDACSQTPAGGIDRVSTQGDPLTIEGWAPWSAETDTQGIRVLSARKLRASVSTITRPDIAEHLQDYRFVKSGFRLQLSGEDGKTVRPDEVVLSTIGTPGGELRLACCGCPAR